jgi:hypothetical protein
MRRRNFISLVGGAAAAWPLAARAQQAGRIYRLGFLIPAGRQAPAVLALFDELRSNGFIEGQNLRSLLRASRPSMTALPSVRRPWSKPHPMQSLPVPNSHCARFRR